MVGIGAIVGGGILVLAGVAYENAGPGAILAFAVNGAVALITALSFAEISSSFPESGGTYTFAKKVLSVRSAFAVGWVLWFAYIVAGVLYAVGFASYATLAIAEIWQALAGDAPAWLGDRRFQLLLSSLATIAYAASLAAKSGGGGQFATIGKVVVFFVLIVVGLVVLARQPLQQTGSALSPFLPGGASGLLAAMGFTFIALQGFDLIAAIAGEVKDPARNIPRAMFLSLGTALVVYLPLLFIVATVGVRPGEHIAELAAEQPETVVAVAAGRFMGPVGYWLVVVAAVLSTLSALRANLLAASRVALSMARDNTLPVVLARTHEQRGTPTMAIYATTLTLVAIGFMVPDLAGAGAAASLIFLVAFALTHGTVYLARIRGGGAKDAYRTPLFPLVPVVGGLACAALAVFQAVVAPVAAAIALFWVGLGAFLYAALLASRAESADASAQALDPALLKLRGKSPLVLLPVANPGHARALVAVANALVPSNIGRVLLLTVLPRPQQDVAAVGPDGATAADADDILRRLKDAQEVVKNALTASYATGQAPEALITAAREPWREIERVASAHACECLLLGMSHGATTEDVVQVEGLINRVDCDVGILYAPPAWQLADARRVLVPIGGRGGQHEMRARLLGSIVRTAPREVVFLQVVAEGAGADEIEQARRQAESLVRWNLTGQHEVAVVAASDVATAVVEAAANCDLLVMGLQAERNPFGVGRGRAAFGELSLEIARRASCATILLSGRRGSFMGI